MSVLCLAFLCPESAEKRSDYNIISISISIWIRIWNGLVLIRSDYRFSLCVASHDSISSRDLDSLSSNKALHCDSKYTGRIQIKVLTTLPILFI